MKIYSEHEEKMKELNKGSSQKKGGRCCFERTEAVKELTRYGQCVAIRGAHVHDQHVIL